VPHEVDGRRRFVDLMAAASPNKLYAKESISARYDGLADEDYVAVLAGRHGRGSSVA